MNDTFADGDRTNGGDPLDVSWFKATTGSTLAVITNDATFGSALRYDTDTVLSATVAAMPTTSLQVGETLRLTVTFRYETTPPANAAGVLRMGLFTNNGGETLGDTATVEADGSGHKADGYYASFSSGTPTNNTTTGNGFEVFRETDDNNTILAGNRLSMATPTYTAAGMAGTGSYTAMLEMTRNASSITFKSFLQDGNGTSVQVAAGTDSSSTITSFDTIAISTGGNTATWLIDGVTVELIPEPSAMLLGMLGGLSLLGVRRR